MEHTDRSTSFSLSVDFPNEATPRHLKERTEKHYCIKCLRQTPAEEYLRNDFLCEKCAEVAEEYPLRSTPDKDEGGRMKDE